jgi:hypothetical protein
MSGGPDVGCQTWRRHSCLPRRDWSRRSRSAPMHSTTDSQTHAERVPPLPGSLLCKQRFDATRLRFSPNDRRTHLARRSPRCGPRLDSPAWPSIPLKTGAVAMGRPSAAGARERDWRGWHRPPDRSDPAVRRAAEMPPQPALWAPEPGTSVQSPRSRESGPSKRTRGLRKACGEVDTLREEGCREGATSQRAIFPQDIGGGDGAESLARQDSAFRPGKFSYGGACAETSLGAAGTSACATTRELYSTFLRDILAQLHRAECAETSLGAAGTSACATTLELGR